MPNDLSIDELPHQTPDCIIGPFSKASEGGSFMGYSVGGTGWYRKHFILDRADNGKLVKVSFDGAMMESALWINGLHLTYRVNGYAPFAYDLTP